MFFKNLIQHNRFRLLFPYLLFQFLEDNFSFIYVFENSSTLLPTFYKISAFWSAHEGSFLLMILFLSGSMFINNSFFSGQDWMPISNATLAFILFLQYENQ